MIINKEYMMNVVDRYSTDMREKMLSGDIESLNSELGLEIQELVRSPAFINWYKYFVAMHQMYGFMHAISLAIAIGIELGIQIQRSADNDDNFFKMLMKED